MSAVLVALPHPVATVPERDADITAAVRRYAHKIGCDKSNTHAAIAWALKSSAHTLQAVREGHQRANQLRARQPDAVA